MMNFDPSKLSPQAIQEMTDLMRSLTPDQMMKMQTIMHNSMAGFNVAKEVEEFEHSLPPGFREKMARITYLANGIEVPSPSPAPVSSAREPENIHEARLVILRSVSQGMMSPEDAIKVLFPES